MLQGGLGHAHSRGIQGRKQGDSLQTMPLQKKGAWQLPGQLAQFCPSVSIVHCCSAHHVIITSAFTTSYCWFSIVRVQIEVQAAVAWWQHQAQASGACKWLDSRHTRGIEPRHSRFSSRTAGELLCRVAGCSGNAAARARHAGLPQLQGCRVANGRCSQEDLGVSAKLKHMCRGSIAATAASKEITDACLPTQLHGRQHSPA
jgi:hypothetical protein